MKKTLAGSMFRIARGVAIVVALFAARATSRAGVLFQDTFNVAAQTTDLNNNQAARQAGGSVTATYSTTLTGGNNYLAQIFAGTPSVLGVGNDGGVTSYIYPNYNFEASHAAGGHFYIALDMNPTFICNDTSIDDTVWGSIRFGQDSNQNFVNANVAGVGFLLRRNNEWQAFNGSTAIGSGTLDPRTTHHIEFRIADATDNNPFDGANNITIQMYADGGATPFLTYTRTSFANNYVTFGQVNNHTPRYYFTSIDNLEIGTAAAAAAPIAVSVSNPSFESQYNPAGGGWASASSWVYSGPSQYESYSSTAGGAWSGLSAQAGSCMANWTGQTITQDLGVPAVANATYTITFYCGRPNSQGQGTIRAELIDGAGTILNSGILTGPTTSPVWQKYTVTGTAGASVSGNLTIRFTSVSATSGNPNWLDNIMVERTAVAQTVPAAPTGLTATKFSHVRIDLSWTDASSDEDGFKIERADDDGSGNPNAATWTQIAAPAANATSYSNTGLTPSTKYHYRVRANNTAGDSSWAGPVNATTDAPPPPPPAPSGMTATAFSAVQINLAWTDNSSDETGFKIERAPDNAGSPGTWAQMATVGAGVTSFLSTGLTPATKYHFRVRAYSVNGDSGYSNEPNATTPAGSPNDYTWLGLTSAAWNNVNNWLKDGAVASQFPGDNGGSGNGSSAHFGGKNAGANNPSLSDNDRRVSTVTFQDAWELNLNTRWLTLDWIAADIPGANATARIYGGGGLRSYNSLSFSAAVGDTLVLDSYFKPTGSNNRTENFVGGGTVAANGGFDNDNKTITYNVQGNTTLLNNHYMNSVGGNTGSLTVDAGSTAAGDGNFQVLTSTINGTVSPSDGGNANTGMSTLTFSGGLTINGTYAADITAGGACDKVAATGALTLGAASRVVISGSALADSYVLVTYSTLSGTFNAGSSVLPLGYELNHAFEGNQIALVKQAAPVAPNAPSGLGATAAAVDQINLAWTDNSASESGFKIERADDDGAGNPNAATWSQIAAPAANATSYSDTGLAAATKYHYRVAAHNVAGDSAWCTPASATTLTPPHVPNAPSGLTATAISAVQIRLTWTDNADNEDRFKIERADDDGAGNPNASTWAQIGTIGANVTTYNSVGLTPETGYHYRVRANSGTEGDSDYSNEASDTTLAGAANNGFTWTGVADSSWLNVNNWLFAGAVPARAPGSGNDGDVVYFGGWNAGAFDPASKQTGDDRVSSLNFQDAWDLNLGTRTLRMDGVSVSIPAANGTARVFGGSGLQSYSSLAFSAAAGDTLVIDSYFKPTGSGNRTHTFNGGGTVAANGGFDNDTKTITYNVQGNTTLLNNNYLNSAGGNSGSLTVDAGSTAAGDGNFQVLTSTINGTVSPSDGGNANSGMSTLTFSGNATVNGTYAVDITAGGTSDKVVVTGALNLGAGSKVVVSGPVGVNAYVIATYTTLSGKFNIGTSVLPEQYKLDYAYGGENKIALIKQPASVFLLR